MSTQTDSVAAGANAPVRIEVWSDYVCPFCVLEEPVLDQVREVYGDDVEIEWRAYELRPDPVPTLDPDGDYLHSIWARAVYPMADQRGMTLRLPPVQPRSRLAHEAERFAREAGHGDAMRRALFRAFFEDGRDIGRLEVLEDIAREVGLDADALRHALDEGTHAGAVVADRRMAEEIGIHGVPAMLVARDGAPLSEAVLVSGAQPFETLRKAIETARDPSPD
ncbi:DsbA family protein [Lysobacter korlensis]|uniref:DsbA family protein n=1 Tax=Lysobacter korlensis TaxID=553636 RepID=A0ABV6RSX4_9GAMM